MYSRLIAHHGLIPLGYCEIDLISPCHLVLSTRRVLAILYSEAHSLNAKATYVRYQLFISCKHLLT